ncbi:MAG TPA: hypothetical protein VJ528_06790 [Geothrix sp.]|nr:hypothetical protein [Geothrix sp.]
MARALGLGLAFCLMLLGCGGGGGSSSPVTPGAPQLTATYDPYKVEIKLTWTAAVSNIDGYNLEYSYNSGAYAPINQTPIFGGVTTASLTFTSTPPELGTFDFRICSVWNGTKGPYSNVAEIKIPIAPPSYVGSAYQSSTRSIWVSWASQSQIADHLVLERATCDATGQITGAWTTLPLTTPLASEYTDSDLNESLGYLYRISAWTGGLSSPITGPTQTIYVPPLAPDAFAAQSLPGAVALSWVNRSTTATKIQVLRYTPGIPGASVIATLPGTATSYQDSGLSLGYYAYSLKVSDSRSITTSPDLLAAPANPMNAPVLSQAALPSVGISIQASAMTLDGQWAFGQASLLSIPPVSWGTWPAWSPSGNSYVSPEFLRLDAQARPHALYYTESPTEDTLVHAWYDGSGWTTETVLANPQVNQVLTASFNLDPTGTPQVLHDTGPGGIIQGLSYSRKVSGTWIHESIDPSNTTRFTGVPQLALDALDTPHALVRTYSSTLEYSRNADGTWTAQTLPNSLPSTSYYILEDSVWLDSATAWAIYQTPDLTTPSNDAFWAMQKVAGVWQAPVLLKSFTHPGTASASIALSSDGTRVAVVFNTTNGLYLNTWTAAQGWVESLLPIPPDAQPLPYLKAAFDGANRLHILVKPSIFSGNLVDLHE